ncbi:S24 family peptidase [Bombella saccharophila]|uniref:S24 family peptidase n=1 Tax=Bombella saccharophila TaxID=2967338 RepID=A0ABT3W6B5_9PROT|nr:S24 family peptidase [Bombella saccharophila]MCX5614416.1 S24 family peptidase [Bombella saccharophila]
MPKSSIIDEVRRYLSDAAASAPSASHMAHPKQSQLDGTYGLVRIPEYDVQAAAGAGLEVPDLQDASRIWTLPRSALAGVRATSLNNLAIVTVAGESMIPDYLPGEKVLVDVGDRIVSHDGAYIIHNRYGLVVKMVQIIPGSSPEQDVLRIISKNPDYSPYDQPVADVMIQGRVVGKWVWK